MRKGDEAEMGGQAVLGGVLAGRNDVTNPPGEIADIELVKLAQAGDRGAFGQLYARYARMVHGALLARVPHAAVEDLVQDVFLHAMPKVSGLRDVSRFGAWLGAIARNMATDYHRSAFAREGETKEVLEEETLPAIDGGSEESGAQEILEIVVSLPEAYRETMILRLVEGMTGPEIAELTGMTHGSVRVNLHRGMAQLREMLRKRKMS